VEGESLATDHAAELGVDGGAVVRRVADASPADTAGVVPADVIVAVDGQAVVSMTALTVMLRGQKPGQVVTLTVMRGKAKQDVKATLAERPAA
jgi:S1-C subfamily serine protease